MNNSLSTNYSRQCVLVQMEAVHEEVIASVVHSLNANNYHVNVIVNEDCKLRRGDIFEVGFDHLDFCVSYVNINGKQRWDDLRLTINSMDDIDFCLFNTFQRAGIMLWSQELNVPVIGLVHNVRLFIDSIESHASLADGFSGLVVLADHVKNTLLDSLAQSKITYGRFEVRTIFPCDWGARTEKSFPTNHALHFAIPGGVDFRNRDFEGLIKSLCQIGDREIGVKFVILGGGPDRGLLSDSINEHNLCKYFDFAPLSASGKVVYRTYFEYLARCHCILPLLPRRSSYERIKISSSFPLALGFGMPVFLRQGDCQMGNLPCIFYENYQSLFAFQITELESELEASMIQCRNINSARLEENAIEMNALLASIGF